MIFIKYLVSGKDFANRVEFLRNIYRIYPVDNITLLGPRRIGKSYIAEQFLETLTYDNTVKFRFNVQRNIVLKENLQCIFAWKTTQRDSSAT